MVLLAKRQQRLGIKHPPKRHRMPQERRGLQKGRKRHTSKLRALKERLEAAQKALVIKKYGKDCFTCPQKNLNGRNCQLGHVPWPRAHLSTECKYDIRFTRIQCFRCNIGMGGMGAVALQRMKDEGIDVDAMRSLSESTKGKLVPQSWFQEKLEDYESQI